MIDELAAVDTLERELTKLCNLNDDAVRVYDAVWSLLGGDEDERGLTEEELEDAQRLKVVARKVMRSVNARVEAHRAKLRVATLRLHEAAGDGDTAAKGGT